MLKAATMVPEGSLQADHEVEQLSSSSCTSAFGSFRHSETELMEGISISFFTFDMLGSKASFLGINNIDSFKQN